MKGVVFLGDRRLTVAERPVAEPGAGEVRVKLLASGICGSDLAVYRAAQVPGQVAGHEPSGVVEALGPGVQRLAVGTRVTVHHHLGCGVCPLCARGETVACAQDRVVGCAVPGSFAESLVVPERNCVPLPDGVSAVDGAFMACVGGTAFAALRRLQVAPHDTLAVFGLGPVGLSCVILGAAMGLRVIGLDVQPHRLELARACGAEAVVHGADEDVPAAMRAFGRILGAEHLSGVDYLIETSGSAPARRAILPSLRREGRAAIVGVGSNEEVICPSAIHAKAATLIGSVVFPLGWLWDLAAFLAASRTSFEPAVTHRYGLDDAEQALRTADEATGGKVIFQPHG